MDGESLHKTTDDHDSSDANESGSENEGDLVCLAGPNRRFTCEGRGNGFLQGIRNPSKNRPGLAGPHGRRREVRNPIPPKSAANVGSVLRLTLSRPRRCRNISCSKPRLADLDAPTLAALQHLVGSLDDRGFLTQSPADVACRATRRLSRSGQAGPFPTQGVRTGRHRRPVPVRMPSLARLHSLGRGDSLGARMIRDRFRTPYPSPGFRSSPASWACPPTTCRPQLRKSAN